MLPESLTLCGANSYQEKYFFNPAFSGLPQQVKDELQVMCVLFTEKVGGALILEFLQDGTLTLSTAAADGDFYYDEIDARIQAGRLSDEKKELFESLEKYFRVKFLDEKIELSEARAEEGVQQAPTEAKKVDEFDLDILPKEDKK